MKKQLRSLLIEILIDNVWIIFALMILFIIFFPAPKIFGAEIHSNLTLYTTTTDSDITVAWDDTNTEIQDYFEFYMWNYGEQQKYAEGKTQQLQITFKLPRTGLWVFYVRACDKPDTDSTRLCSEWANSNLVDSETGTPYGKVEDPNNPGQFINGKWMIYGHVAAPTGGGVE